MSTALTPAPRTLSCNLTESDIATLLSSIFTTVTLPSPTVSKNVTQVTITITGASSVQGVTASLTRTARVSVGTNV